MREILFTGKRKDNGKRVEGYYLYRGEECSKIGTDIHYIITHDLCGFSWHEVIPETVGQFTGLYDNTKWEELTTDEQALFLYPELGGKRSKEDWKGRRVFEGDVFGWNDGEIDEATGEAYQDEISIVCFDETKMKFVIKNQYGACANLYQALLDSNLRYVGNIYDNPELLKGV